MSSSTIDSLASLYEEDETAWLEQMAQLISQQRFSELDYANLQEFLSSMARRDKRELLHRLIVLIAHRLKWQYQPDKRTNSWRATIAEQQRQVEFDLQSGSLRNYARETLAKAYDYARKQAALETGLAESEFPAENPRSLEDWVSKEDV